MNAYMDFICALLFAHQFNLLNTKSITYCMYILQFYVNTKYIDSYTRMIDRKLYINPRIYVYISFTVIITHNAIEMFVFHGLLLVL